MITLKDYSGKDIRLTDERLIHIQTYHPELSEQINKFEETLLIPDKVVLSNTDNSVELYYKYYDKTPVTKKFMCAC